MLAASFNGTTVHFQVRWADRVASFIQDWENSLVNQADDTEHWHQAVDTVLGAIEHGPDQAEQVLAEVYELTGQLPVPGDRVWVGPLEVQVDQRCFALARKGPHSQTELHYLLGIESYRYGTLPSQPLRNAATGDAAEL